MIYLQQVPAAPLQNVVKSFWLVDSEGDATPNREKIIPDGYPELVFHYGDPYRTNIEGTWEDQTMSLLAGQIRNHFFLENTGVSRMFAIKFQPWALRLLFGVKMAELTDRVIDLPAELQEKLSSVHEMAISEDSFDKKVDVIADLLTQLLPMNDHPVVKATKILIEEKGLVSINELTAAIGSSERSLERYFREYIGLSPKFYTRIIRFSHVFKLVDSPDDNLTQLSYMAGYYDQPHFIRNFQEFTGEDPSKYGFTDKNMANFFLKK